MKTSIKKGKSIVIKTISKQLKSYQKSEKPHSLQDIVDKLSIPIRTLRKITPELCKSISQHRIQVMKQVSKQKRININKKVFTGTKKFLHQGIYPSQAKIAKLLPHRAYLLSIDIRNSIKKAKFAFEIQNKSKT